MSESKTERENEPHIKRDHLRCCVFFFLRGALRENQLCLAWYIRYDESIETTTTQSKDWWCLIYDNLPSILFLCACFIKPLHTLTRLPFYLYLRSNWSQVRVRMWNGLSTKGRSHLFHLLLSNILFLCLFVYSVFILHIQIIIEEEDSTVVQSKTNEQSLSQKLTNSPTPKSLSLGHLFYLLLPVELFQKATHLDSCYFKKTLYNPNKNKS